MATFQQTPAGQSTTLTFDYVTPGNPVVSLNGVNASLIAVITASRLDGSSTIVNNIKMPIEESNDSSTRGGNKIAPGWRRPVKFLGVNKPGGLVQLNPQSYRYWRFIQVTGSGGSGVGHEMSEFVLVNNQVYVSGGTWSFSNDPVQSYPQGFEFGSLTNAAFSDSNLTARAFTYIGSSSTAAYLQYDHGSQVTATGWKQAYYFGSAYITGCLVMGSNDNVNYTSIKLFSGLPSPGYQALSPEYTF
jgi:hypothetical protein